MISPRLFKFLFAGSILIGQGNGMADSNEDRHRRTLGRVNQQRYESTFGMGTDFETDVPGRANDETDHRLLAKSYKGKLLSKSEKSSSKNKSKGGFKGKSGKSKQQSDRTNRPTTRPTNRPTNRPTPNPTNRLYGVTNSDAAPVRPPSFGHFDLNEPAPSATTPQKSPMEAGTPSFSSPTHSITGSASSDEPDREPLEPTSPTEVPESLEEKWFSKYTSFNDRVKDFSSWYQFSKPTSTLKVSENNVTPANNNPTLWPSYSPVAPTAKPSATREADNNERPTNWPTFYPTISPIVKPTSDDSTEADGNENKPTDWPTFYPTLSPVKKPTAIPTNEEEEGPTSIPTYSPTWSEEQDPFANINKSSSQRYENYYEWALN